MVEIIIYVWPCCRINIVFRESCLHPSSRQWWPCTLLASEPASDWALEPALEPALDLALDLALEPALDPALIRH